MYEQLRKIINSVSWASLPKPKVELALLLNATSALLVKQARGCSLSEALCAVTVALIRVAESYKIDSLEFERINFVDFEKRYACKRVIKLAWELNQTEDDELDGPKKTTVIKYYLLQICSYIRTLFDAEQKDFITEMQSYCHGKGIV